jgi:hypothetical protein
MRGDNLTFDPRWGRCYFVYFFYNRWTPLES